MGFEQETIDALKAARAADASAYRSTIGQAESWAAPKPPVPPTPVSSPAATPGVLNQWANEAKSLASSARDAVNGRWSDGTGLGGKVLNGIGGLVAKGGAALATGGALADSADADSTDRYAKRFGVAPPTGDGSWDDLLKFAALRAGGFASDLGNRLTGGLAGRLVYQDNPGAVAAASNAAQPKSAVDTRVGNIMAANPELGGAAPMLGDGGANPNDPAAIAARGRLAGAGIDPGSAGISVLPSSANSDRSYLANAFAKYINSGDLEGARRTAVSQADHAAIGLAEQQQMRAQAEAAQNDPLRRMLREALDNAMNGDKRITAGRPVLRKGEKEPGQPDWMSIAQGISGILNNQKPGQQKSPMEEALSQALAQAGINASQNDQAAKAVDLQGKISDARDKQQVSALRAALIGAKTDDEREKVSSALQTITGKFEKGSNQQKKLYPVDIDTGQKDAMGQPIFKKGLADEDGKVLVGGPPQAAKPTRSQLEADAKSAIAKGANKDQVNAALAAKIKELGL